MNSKKFLAAAVAMSFVAAPVVRASELSDAFGDAANEAGQVAVDSAIEAVKPVYYAGKAVVNGVAFVVLKTTQGVIMVAEAAVRGVEFAVEGAKFVALKTVEGVVWVAEKAVLAGEIILDAVADGVELLVDGVVYVAAKIEAGVVFVAKKTWEAAKATGELVVKGVKYVAKQTKKGIVFVAKGVKFAAMRARRGALVVELRTNLASALAVGGVTDNTITYFKRRAADRDPVVARLAQACLAASSAFNDLY